MHSLIIAWFILLPMLIVIAGIDITKQISYGEIIAIAVSIAGGLIVFCIWFWRRRKERSRINSLITYPDTWKATRMLSKESLVVRADIHIVLPYNSYSVVLYVRDKGKPVKMEALDVEPAVGSKKGRLVVTGNTPLASLPASVKEVEVWTEITLDGAIHRKSKKRTLPITDFGNPPSIPDKEDSPTE